jgi:uncharacterized membrane protein YdjX (TVP38/TMEM64 family)
MVEPVQTSGRVTRRTAVIRAVIGLIVVIAVLIAASMFPIPSVSRMREWADSFGPAFVWVFFVAYALIVIFPVPRSAFTVASGLLFGPAVGFTGAMLATTFAAVAAFVLVRRYGRSRIRPYLHHPLTKAVELRMERRGWLAVGSLRLIAVCPFSVTNYIAALSSIKFVPYALATVVGVMPGTAAVVLLGDALTGEGDVWSLVLSAALFSVGVIGLVVDARMGVNTSTDGVADAEAGPGAANPSGSAPATSS